DPDEDFDEFEDFEDEEGDAQKYWFTTTKLEVINRVHDYLDSLPATGKVLSLATLWKIGRDINQGEPLDDFMLAILFQQMPEDFKDSMVRPYASIEHNQARVSVRIKDSLKSLRRDTLLKKIRSDLMGKVGLKEDQFRLSGLMVLYNNMLQSLFQSQVLTLGTVFLAIMAMFLVLFRSIRTAVTAIIPTLLSATLVLGLMGWFGIPLDLMTITIAAITVGIGVDDTIHYVHRFRYEFAVDGDYWAAIDRCHRSIGRAIYYTSVTIMLGFSILVLSNFIPTIYFGILTSLAMLVALLANMTLLPLLIVAFRTSGEPRSA
ncbi:MAG: MMPL family transporter, partial [Proteobacteria bacterium]|nr:MMPL family transporter [Pseudomonadota bacterium]